MNKKILTCLFCFFLACFLANSLQAKKVVRILIDRNSKFQGDWNSALEEQLAPYKKIRVTNTSTTTDLNEFQVKFTFNPSSDPEFFQHCGTNGENLGIWTEDKTKLPSWIENWSSSSATVWFKVHSIPTGDSKIYKLYCSPSKKGNNNPDEVFDFFDDFNDGTIDPNKWEWYVGNLNSATRVDDITPYVIAADEGVTYPGMLYFHPKPGNFYTPPKFVYLKSKKRLSGKYKLIIDTPLQNSSFSSHRCGIYTCRVQFRLQNHFKNYIAFRYEWTNNSLPSVSAGIIYKHSSGSTGRGTPYNHRGPYELYNLYNIGKVVFTDNGETLTVNTSKEPISEQNIVLGAYMAYMLVDEIKAVKAVDSEPLVSFE